MSASGGGRAFQGRTGSRATSAAPTSDGNALSASTREYFEPRLRQDLSHVRVHADGEGARFADGLGARAVTAGSHIAFGAGEYRPGTEAGRKLIAHELVHVIQQQGGRGPGHTWPVQTSRPGDASEREADAIASTPGGVAAPPVRVRTPTRLARQPKEEKKSDEEEPAQDLWKGAVVQSMVLSLARGRIAFRVAQGWITGKVKTDLKPGEYTLKKDPTKAEWIILSPATKTGFRFEVSLDGANPWTMAYPDTFKLYVVQGSTVEPKTWGEMHDDKGLIDPFLLIDSVPQAKPVRGIDDFENVVYDIDYKSVGGNLSKLLRVYYRDGSKKEINLDTITDKNKTPRLWAAKQDAYKIMDDYNALFILGSFQAVWFILTISPTAGVPNEAPPSVSRLKVVKGNATEPPVDAVPKIEDPVPKLETPVPKNEVPVPKNEVPVPKNETPVPKNETPAPKNETPAPKNEVPAPKNETPAPKNETPAPKNETPAPKNETPAPKNETPAPKNETPAPVDETVGPSGEVPVEQPAPNTVEGQTTTASTTTTQGDMAPGSAQHKATRWAEYQARGGKWKYERWSKVYDRNMVRATEAAKAAKAYRDKLGWGKLEVTVDVEGEARRLDIGDPILKRGVEVKTGYQTLTQSNRWEILRDQILREKLGWDIQWRFEGPASKPLKDALTAAKIPFTGG